MLEIDGLALELFAEPGLVLDLGTQARGFTLVVEVGAHDFGAVGVEGDVAPDRAPEARAVARNHVDLGAVFLKDIDGKRRIARGDVLVLEFQVVLEFDRGDFRLEFVGLVAVLVDQERGLDVVAVQGQDLFVAELGQVLLAGKTGGRQHLADGFRLDVRLLPWLERHRGKGQDGGRYHDDDRRVDNGVYVIVGIHR